MWNQTQPNMAVMACLSRRLAGIGLLTLLGAAAPVPDDLQVQIADSGPLGLAAMTPPTPAKVVAQAAGLEPAPVPDPDLGAPLASTGPAEAKLTPALFSQRAEFSGDGFSHNSSQQDATDSRRQPAAGLNWSVPVK